MRENKIFEISEGNESRAIGQLKKAANESEIYHFGQLLKMGEKHPELRGFVVKEAMESAGVATYGLGAAIAYDLMTMQLESEGHFIDVTSLDRERYNKVILQNTPGLEEFDRLLITDPTQVITSYQQGKIPQTKLDWLWERLEVEGQSRYLGLIFSFSFQYEDRFGKPNTNKLNKGLIDVTGLVVTCLDPSLGI